MQNTNKTKYQNKIITIPNMLSLLRIFLIPLIIWLYCDRKDYVMTCAVLTFSGITDIVDGIIARKCNMISDFGKVFDPIADKLTQLTVLACLVIRYKFMLLPIVLLVLKEASDLLTGFLTFRKIGSVLGAEWHGKATTILLYLMMFTHIVWVDIPMIVSSISVLVCIFMIILSAVLYGIRNIKLIQQNK